MSLMTVGDLERNLLFGVLAVQHRFIPPYVLTAGLQVWFKQLELEGQASLSRIFLEHGALSGSDSQVLEGLTVHQLARSGGDVLCALASVPIFSELYGDLQKVGSSHLLDLVQRVLADFEPSTPLPQPDSARTASSAPEPAAPSAVESIPPSPPPPVATPPAAVVEPPPQTVASSSANQAESSTHQVEAEVPQPPISPTLAPASKPGKATVVADSVLTATASQSPLPPTFASAASTDRFTLAEVLGEDDQTVWIRAFDSELAREVVIRRLKPAAAANPQAVQAFREASQLLGTLDHQGIGPLLDVGETEEGLPYQVMRLVRGEPLKAAIERFHAASLLDSNLNPVASKWSSREFLDLLVRFLDVCDTIEHAHRRGLVHSALNAEAVILGRHGETLVTGWDQIRRLDDADDAEALIALDIRALGVLLGQLITGRAEPGPAVTPATTSRSRSGARRSVPVPERLETIRRRALEGPKGGYRRVADLVDDLKSWMARESQGQSAASSTSRFATKRASAHAVAAAAVLVAVVGAAWWWAVNQRPFDRSPELLAQQGDEPELPENGGPARNQATLKPGVQTPDEATLNPNNPASVAWDRLAQIETALRQGRLDEAGTQLDRLEAELERLNDPRDPPSNPERLTALKAISARLRSEWETIRQTNQDTFDREWVERIAPLAAARLGLIPEPPIDPSKLEEILMALGQPARTEGLSAARKRDAAVLLWLTLDRIHRESGKVIHPDTAEPWWQRIRALSDDPALSDAVAALKADLLDRAGQTADAAAIRAALVGRPVPWVVVLRDRLMTTRHTSSTEQTGEERWDLGWVRPGGLTTPRDDGSPDAPSRRHTLLAHINVGPNAEPLVRLAQAGSDWRHGDAARALIELNALPEPWKSAAPIRWARSFALAALGKPEEAEHTLGQAIDSGEPAVRLTRGAIHAARGNRDEARAVWRGLLEENPAGPWAWRAALNLVSLEVEEKRWDRALALLETPAIASSPNARAVLLASRVQLLTRLGRVNEAVQSWTDLVAILGEEAARRRLGPPPSQPTLVAQTAPASAGGSAFSGGNPPSPPSIPPNRSPAAPAEVNTDPVEIESSDATSAEAFRRRGLARLEAAASEAESDFDRALELDPTDVSARVGRAFVRIRSGRWREALEDARLSMASESVAGVSTSVDPLAQASPDDLFRLAVVHALAIPLIQNDPTLEERLGLVSRCRTEATRLLKACFERARVIGDPRLPEYVRRANGADPDLAALRRFETFRNAMRPYEYRLER